MLSAIGGLYLAFAVCGVACTFTLIESADWLAHPGSVGKSMTGTIHVLDDDGNELPVGEEGEVWFETNRTFEYH